MQGMRVRVLVREDPTLVAVEQLSLWATTAEPASRAREPQLLKPGHLESVLRNKRSHRNEKPAHRNEE